MQSEISNYKANLSTFVERLQNSFVYKMVFFVDKQPTFNADLVPFKFRYSFSVTLVTDKGNFKVFPTMTSEGFETFWTEPSELPEDNEEFENINSIINAIHFETIEGFALPYKMRIQYEKTEHLFYCAEIHDYAERDLKYQTNDEMLFVFDNQQEAAKFEQLINHTQHRLSLRKKEEKKF